MPTVQVLQREHELLSSLALSFLEIVRSSVVEEILDDPIFGWIKTNGSTVVFEDITTTVGSAKSLKKIAVRDDEDSYSVLRGYIK